MSKRKRGSLTGLIVLLGVVAGSLTASAAPLPLVDVGFDLNTAGPNWRDPVGGGTTGGIFNDPRHISPSNLLGLSSSASNTGRLQFVATDHTNEGNDDTQVAATHLQYEAATLYTFSAHAFSNQGATFLLQFLANPLPATRAGSVVVAEQLFTGSPASTPGDLLAPDGITNYRLFTVSFDTSTLPSAVGQYISVQIVGTTDSTPGHVAGFPNLDNVDGTMTPVPEPAGITLLAIGAGCLLRRRRS